MLKQLTDAMRFVEENLQSEIDFEEVSKIACVTKDSFMRFFSYMTGMTLKEYVRRRRLTLAAYDVQAGKEKIVDIAVKYGYESPDAFRRAFTLQHGITPMTLRRHGGTISPYPPVSFHIMIKGAEKMNCKVEMVSALDVYGVSREFGTCAAERFEAEHHMWAQDLDFVPGKICEGFDGVWYGIWDKGRYAIAREKEDVSGEKLEKQSIPAGLYAKFITEKGGYAGDALPRLRDLIFNSWLPDSGYKLSGDYEVEVYHLCTDREKRRKNRYYEIWIPVEIK